MAIQNFTASAFTVVGLDLTKAGVQVALLNLENWYRFSDLGTAQLTDSNAVTHSLSRIEAANLLHLVRVNIGTITVPTTV